VKPGKTSNYWVSVINDKGTSFESHNKKLDAVARRRRKRGSPNVMTHSRRLLLRLAWLPDHLASDMILFRLSGRLPEALGPNAHLPWRQNTIRVQRILDKISIAMLASSSSN
jgi:hypothetical protein